MSTSPVGFIGLGIMGVPMATNLVRAGFDTVVWARSAAAVQTMLDVGACAESDVGGVFAAAERIVLMLRDENAVDAVLGRGTVSFSELVRGRLLIQMGTFTTGFSRALADEVEQAGGRYVEAPVSGSRGPAVEGALVAMLAGHDDAIADAEPVVAAMCADVFRCGPVPSALAVKLAVNAYLITMVTGLAEAFHIGERTGVDPQVLRRVLDAGPMASSVSRTKAAKLLQGDLRPQAAISDVRKNAILVDDAAAAVGAAAPLTRICRELYDEACSAGRGGDDMIGVVAALEARARARVGGGAPDGGQ